MSSLTSYEPSNSYHSYHTVQQRPSSRVLDEDRASSVSVSPRARSRIAPMDSVSVEQPRQIQEKKRHPSRYRRSATLSPAAGIRRRGRLERADSSDSNAGEEDYAFLSPNQSSNPAWMGKRASNFAASKRSASPMQTALLGARVQRKPELPRFARNAMLRKTCSEPTDLFLDESDRNKVERIQDILNTLDFTKFHLINRKHASFTQASTKTTSTRGVVGPNPLSPSNSQSSYASGRSSPLVTPSQSPDETWATPRGSLFVAQNHQIDRPSATNLALTRMVVRNAQMDAHKSGDDSDFVSTDIEELKEAAQTIEALTRRHQRRRPSDLRLDTTNMDHQSGQDNSDLAITPLAPQLQALSQATKDAPDVQSANTPSKNNETSASNTSLASTLRHGITTRLGGQPRGVMQFLPSVKSSELLSKTTYESYLANKTRRAYQGGQSVPRNSAESSTLDMTATQTAQMLRRKISMPDQLYQAGQEMHHHSYRHHNYQNQSADQQDMNMDIDVISDDYLPNTDLMDRKMSAPITPSAMDPKTQRYSFRTSDSMPNRGAKLLRQYSQQDKHYLDLDSSGILIETSSPPPASSFKGVDSLGSFSRFGRLLKSLRTSRQNSPELDAASALSPASSDSPLSSPCPSERSPSNVGHVGLRNQPVDGQQVGRPKSQAAGMINTTGGIMSQSWHGGVSKMHCDLNSLHANALNDANPMSDSDSSMMQADLLLWQKRSKGSLRRHQDTRTHIVKEVYDTEASYVENLQLIVHKYLRPLKRPELCTLIDPTLVDEIFFQIPEILGHHELFFAALKSRLDSWDNRQKIGDIILNNFTKQSVIDTYTAFINNWKNAKHAIRAASHAKPAFAKYLERCSREHKNKLTLDALLIMPVQRIPRYELLIKELLKHTSVEHPDHPLLVRAQKEIHELATKINHVEQEAGLAEQMQQRLREIEAIVDGLDDLVSSDRVFYRYDLVSVSTHGVKKERCLFLFSDQLIITNVKRKSAGALRKMPTVNTSSTGSGNFLESNKFKLLMKISLDDLEVTKNNTALLQKIQEEIVQLQEDLRVLGKVSELLLLLKMHHDDVEKEVEKTKDDIRKQLAEKQHEMTSNPMLTSLDLLVTTEAGIETLSVTFQSADKRVAWEKCFNDAKEALALSLSRRPPPVFLKPIAAQRTRSGLHFTCASPTIGRNEFGYPNVWICNSDGYVGQVCVMTLTPEADLSCCNGITNSRILCICAVPDAKHSNHRRSRKASTATSPVSQESACVVDSAYNLELDSDSSDNEEQNLNGGAATNGAEPGISSSSSGVSTEPGTTASTSSLASTDPQQRKKSPKSSTTTGSGEGQTNAETTQSEDLQGPTMWLGTEDGCVHIFNYNDSVRTRRNKMKIQHGASVVVITSIDDRVLVALGDGSLLYYDRDQDGNWDLDHFRFIELEQLSRGPISCMLVVTNRLWIGVRNKICVLNPHALKLEHVFQVSSDVESIVGCMSNSGLGVWLSMQSSPVIKLHHAHSYECLLEVNVSPTVTKTLAGCDDIIRQHKLSCLRVTTLMCVKDYLWIGTSAGVLLHLGLPHITHNTTRLNTTPALSSVPLGHCGQCRFLTCVELAQPSNPSRSSSRAGSYTMINEMSRRRMSLNVATLQQGKVYVISGGDGFEDFQDMANDEGDDNMGRDDSTNHILIWHA